MTLQSADSSQELHNVSAEDVAQRLGMQKGDKRRYWCPVCQPEGGKDPDLELSDHGFKCFKCDAAGGILDLVCHVRGSDRREAAQWLTAEGLLSPNDDAERKNIMASRSKIDENYPYHDENGELVFEVVRMIPKSFRPRRPRPDSGPELSEYLWGLNAGWYNAQGYRTNEYESHAKWYDGAGRVLYRLPNVAQAVRLGNPIYMCEGEKDADKLATLGVTATTVPCGAGQWRAEYADTLKDAKVVILPDADERGRKGAQTIAKELRGVAEWVKIVDLWPDRKDKVDVTDWLDGQGDLDTLYELVSSTPEFDPLDVASDDDWQPLNTWACLTTEPEPREWIIDGVLARGDLGALISQGGMGKTYLAMEIGISAACGRELLPFFKPSSPSRVLVMAAEDGENVIHQRMLAIAEEFELSQDDMQRVAGNLVIYAGMSEPLTASTWQGTEKTRRYTWLRDRVQEHDTDLVILDPKARWDGAMNENDARSGTAFVVALQDLIREKQAACLVLHHVAKCADSTSPDAGRGSTALRDGVRWQANLTAFDEHEAKKYEVDQASLVGLRVVKSNYTPIPPSPTIFQRMENGVLREHNIEYDRQMRVARDIAAWSRQYGKVNQREFMRLSGDGWKDFKKFMEKRSNSGKAPTKEVVKEGVELAISKGLIVQCYGKNNAKMLAAGDR